MLTLLKDSNVALPGVRKRGHRVWFLFMADAAGFEVYDTLANFRPVKARVDHGRWLADCPYCGGAECVTLDDPVFMCLSCGNEDAGGCLLLVQFPPALERGEIERLLKARPLYAQNWSPYETVEKITQENATHSAALRGGN